MSRVAEVHGEKLFVHLDDPESGAVSFKPHGIKGARWRSARSIYEACLLADDVMPLATSDNPRDIEYVTKKT